MTSLIKFELGKILRNRTVFGGIVVGCLVLLGIFFVGYHYSQLSMSEASNKKKGFEKSLDVIIDEKYSGEFTDEKVKMILSDSMNNFQENEEQKVVNKPFYPFYWEMGDTFFSKDAENVYSEMIEQVNKGQRLTIEDVDLYSLDEVGFKKFDTPLTLGNYVPWTDLYRVLGYIYALLSIITILVSSIVFSDDNSKNINQILLVTKYGRNKMIFAKLIATSIITVSLFIIFQLVNIGVFSTMYDMSGWNSDIQTNLSLGLFDFPLQYNHIQIYFLILVMQLVGIGFVESVTLLISALMHSSMSVLAVSLGVYILPLLLVQMIKTGVGNKILYLFPINNLNVQNILGILYSKDAFFFHSFFINIGFIFIFADKRILGVELRAWQALSVFSSSWIHMIRTPCFYFAAKRIPESKAFYGKVTAFCFSTRDLMSEHSAGLVIQQRPLRLPQNNINFSWKASPLLQSALSQSLLTRLEPFSFVQYVENKIHHYGAYLIVTGTYPRTEYR